MLQRVFSLCMFWLILGSSLFCQDSGIPRLSQEEIATHLVDYVAPAYPPIAQAAQVQGDVVASVEIGFDGVVRSAKILSGPAMLRQVTLDALKKWRYQPFHRGTTEIVITGDVMVRFTLRDKPEVHTPHESTAKGSYSVSVTFPSSNHNGEPDAAIAERFDQPWEACSHGVIAHSVDVATADECKKAAAVADEFTLDNRAIQRRMAYVYAATSLANVRDLKTALAYADKAVDVVKLGHDGTSGSEAAYSIRGQIRAFLGDMEGGNRDMSIAEDFCRKGQLMSQLRKDLQFHAELLKRMGRPQEAQLKLDEASRL